MAIQDLDAAQQYWLESYLSNWSHVSVVRICQDFGGLAAFLRERAEYEDDADTVRTLNAIASRIERS